MKTNVFKNNKKALAVDFVITLVASFGVLGICEFLKPGFGWLDNPVCTAFAVSGIGWFGSAVVMTYLIDKDIEHSDRLVLVETAFAAALIVSAIVLKCRGML